MDWKEYLLSCRGWQDGMGNTVSFSQTNLLGEIPEEGIWLFLDEGLRCGGRNACVLSMEEVEQVLLGCGKKELWNILKEDWERVKEDVF